MSNLRGSIFAIADKNTVKKFEKCKIDIYYCGMISLEVVLSPALLHLTDVRDSNVVVIDILRATSTICTAIHEGAESVLAVNTPEEALGLRSQGYLAAAERNGVRLDGFDLGNSPFECMHGAVSGRRIGCDQRCCVLLCSDSRGDCSRCPHPGRVFGFDAVCRDPLYDGSAART